MMTRKEVTEKFTESHRLFAEYIQSLSNDEFLYSQDGKWTPGQQLDHVVKCLAPLGQILGTKPIIELKFGSINRPSLSYENIIKNYQIALDNGGEAPHKFLPDKVGLNDKQKLMSEVITNAKIALYHLNNYSDTELEVLALPHPLLGKLSIKEMLYLMTYHVEHHHMRTKQNLVQKVNEYH
jgi:hypothetical protein